MGVVQAAQASPEVDRVLGMRRGIEGLLEGSLIDLTDLDADRAERIAGTPGAALGSCRRRITDEDIERAGATLRDHDVKYVCYIGGNDSADTTHRISAESENHLGLHAVAVPKTIDNDLPETDHCPGYGSIARFVATAVLETALDTRSLPRAYPIKIIEVMGRDAGWVAVSAGLGSRNPELGPHVIWPPELPFDPAHFLARIEQAHRDCGYAIAVVAETIRDKHGQPVGAELASVDDFGHPIMRGTADTLMRLVERELGVTARFDKPGGLQRSSFCLRSDVDAKEAREVGTEAVRLVLEGQTDVMVGLRRLDDSPYRVETFPIPLEKIANRQRALPADYFDPRELRATDAFRRYAQPLLGAGPIGPFETL